MNGKWYIMLTLFKGKQEWLYFIKGDFRIKNIVKDIEGCFTITSRLVHEADITTLEIYSCKKRTSKDSKEKLTELKREINPPL